MSDIKRMIETIRGFPGVTRKHPIHEVVDMFPTYSFEKVVAAEGEDAAVLDTGSTCVLFAADGIMEKLLQVDPFLAGYYAVLVNVNDIAAMGGRPLGMVDVISFREGKVGTELLRGIQAGVSKFGVPIVGGHTHPDCNYDSIEISIIGTVAKEDALLSSTARDGDDIVFIIDIDGRFPETVPYTFDSTSSKSDELVRAQMEAVCKVAEGHLAHACKDMSNPGHVGTLGMMLESSEKGGIVDVTKIPIPQGVDEIDWAMTYFGCAFVFACDPECSQTIIDIFKDVGCEGAVVGKIDDTKKLKLTDGQTTDVLFDFNVDSITGVKVKRRDCKPPN